MKQYYWAENLENYKSDNELGYDEIIEIKRLNFFIGRNNAGKSRFLRSLFLESKASEIFNKFFILSYFKKARKQYALISDISYGAFTKKDTNKIKLKNMIEELSRRMLFQEINENEVISYLITIDELINSLLNFTTDEISVIKTLETSTRPINIIFNNKYYVPTLRGMRFFHLDKKIDETKTPYLWRTMVDYFDEEGVRARKDLVEKILTGENLYDFIQKYRNGYESQWQMLEEYQNILSKYFFNNQRLTLIPIHEDNIIHIKIGSESQYPISQLGDGLQQAIILTYEAFIKKDEIHAFFIEEPELHMHAGMVRQLMNFYLNETQHYYFFTTHSNHLLDMVDESDDVIIHKFSKSPDGSFQINRCDKDRDLLASLGVKPSSVYLANCTIWVEGITDRLYITKYMQKYLADLKTTNTELYKKYLRFMPNYHYTFVEYAGSNLTHWNFDDEYTDETQDNGLNALAVCSNMLLLADGDIQSKGNRVSELTQQLTQENFLLLECKEIENTLPDNIIIATAKDKFSRMQANTTHGFDISVLDSISGKVNFYHSKNGIGKILDNSIRLPNTKGNYCFSDKSGTIKEKLKFCRLILSTMDTKEWQLTPSAINICEKIFNHIEKCNQ